MRRLVAKPASDSISDSNPTESTYKRRHPPASSLPASPVFARIIRHQWIMVDAASWNFGIEGRGPAERPGPPPVFCSQAKISDRAMQSRTKSATRTRQSVSRPCQPRAEWDRKRGLAINVPVSFVQQLRQLGTRN
jgi:hypothetical protein